MTSGCLQIKNGVRQSGSFLLTREGFPNFYYNINLLGYVKSSWSFLLLTYLYFILLRDTGNSRICHEANRQDKDLGGSNMRESGIHHFILIENLEKDLSPSSIMEFIHKQTSISAEAYIFPNLSSESFTRGAIVVECKEKLKKMYDFLNNPDHIVTSSRGRYALSP